VKDTVKRAEDDEARQQAQAEAHTAMLRHHQVHPPDPRAREGYNHGYSVPPREHSHLHLPSYRPGMQRPPGRSFPGYGPPGTRPPPPRADYAVQDYHVQSARELGAPVPPAVHSMSFPPPSWMLGPEAVGRPFEPVAGYSRAKWEEQGRQYHRRWSAAEAYERRYMDMQAAGHRGQPSSFVERQLAFRDQDQFEGNRAWPPTPAPQHGDEYVTDITPSPRPPWQVLPRGVSITPQSDPFSFDSSSRCGGEVNVPQDLMDAFRSEAQRGADGSMPSSFSTRRAMSADGFEHRDWLHRQPPSSFGDLPSNGQPYPNKGGYLPGAYPTRMAPRSFDGYSEQYGTSMRGDGREDLAAPRAADRLDSAAVALVDRSRKQLETPCEVRPSTLGVG